MCERRTSTREDPSSTSKSTDTNGLSSRSRPAYHGLASEARSTALATTKDKDDYRAPGTNTILPTCSPFSILSWAWGASAKLNTRSIKGRKLLRLARRGQTCFRKSAAITAFSADDLGRIFEARIVARSFISDETEKVASSPP